MHEHSAEVNVEYTRRHPERSDRRHDISGLCQIARKLWAKLTPDEREACEREALESYKTEREQYRLLQEAVTGITTPTKEARAR